jgi:multidrug transporter EmrE-like cation transporter
VTFVLIVGSVLLTAAAQVLLKLGVTSEPLKSAISSGSVVDMFRTAATSPVILAGFGCFGLSAILWLLVLHRIPLSSAYPCIALGIVVTVAAGYLMFGEAISAQKALGVACIMVGILIVSKSG